jgi:lysophospholipase L1-like esterase
MKDPRAQNDHFWRDAALTALTLVSLAILSRAAVVMSTTPRGCFAAMLISVMRSRAMIDNPGVTGYYERLFDISQKPLFIKRKDYYSWMNLSHDRVYSPSFRLSYLRPNLEWQVQGKVNHQPTNRFGFVGPDWPPQKPPKIRRVALLGDSLAEGWGIQLSQTFGSLLENRLNVEHPNGASERFEVLNFAVPAYSLTQILDVAVEEVPRFEADVHMLALTEWAVDRNWASHLVELTRLGIDPKYDFLRERLRVAGVAQTDDPLVLYGKLTPFRIQVLREIVTAMKRNAEQHHATFFVVLVPAMEDGELSKKRFAGIKELLVSLNIAFIDLLDTFDNVQDAESIRNNPFDAHPNALGHKMIFENLYAKLHARPDAWATLIGNSLGNVQRAGVLSAEQSLRYSHESETR